MGDRGCASLHLVGGSLTSLDLSFNTQIHKSDFLRHLPNVTELDLSLNAWVDDAAVDAVARSMPMLRRLTLEKTDITDLGLAALGRLQSSLEYLDCSRTLVRGTPESYSSLCRMRMLRELLLAYSPVDIQLAWHLPPQLERLKLSRVLAFDDSALECLAKQQLSRSVDDGAAAAATLHSLDVGCPGITDRAIPALQRLVEAGLRSLTLWHTRITPEGAARLMETTGLSEDTGLGMASSAGTYLFVCDIKPRIA